MKKTVIITGGSKGIGAACVKLFAEKGYNVILNYYNSEDAAKELSSSLSGLGFSVTAIKADVSNYKQVKELVERVENEFGKIDILINNAGIAKERLFTETEPEFWQKMIDVNLTGVYNFTHCCIKNMIHNKSGSIVNVSSIWGIAGGSCEVAYSAAKAGIIGFTKALAKETALSNIRVNAVAPGIIDTDMNSYLSKEDISLFLNEVPMERMGTCLEVANTIYFLATEKSSYITGQVLGVDGGLL